MRGITLSILLLSFLLACGGGGGGDGSQSQARHCTVEGYSLYCSAIDYCCPDAYPYACGIPIVGPGDDPRLCSQSPCAFGQEVLDYCGEE